MFGDVDANFSSRGWGRGSGYGYPYGGYGAPMVAPYAVAPVAPAPAEAK